ncbi:beta-propeller fold lactonase family protein, partial [Rhodoblastus sp.]|uniref:beta-propeller fold lactonase family protein n=1 Tax=Rhodoblastus sp. TaxID=1962975 RepID=UPI0035AE1179
MLAGAAVAGPTQADPLAYVTDQGADAVSIVDLAKGAVVETVKVGQKPAGIAVAPGGARIYVSNPAGRSVSVIERQPGGGHKTIAEIAVGQGPLGLALDIPGERLFAADWYADRVYVIDTGKRAVSGEIAVGKSPSGMAVSRDNRWLYVANRESDTISVVDLSTLRSMAEIAVGKAPFGVTYDPNGPDGPRLLVANVQSGDVSVVDPAARRETRRLAVKSFPYVAAATRDGSRIFVTNQHDDSVSVFDGKTYQPRGLVSACGYPEGLLVAPDQREALVACWMDDVLAAIDVNSLKVT